MYIIRLPKLALKPWVRSDPTPILLTNAQIVDVEEGTVCSGYDIFIEEGVIKNIAIGLYAFFWDELETKKPILVDLQGMFVCP